MTMIIATHEMGFRPRCGRRGVLPGQRRDPGAGRSQQIFKDPQQPRTRQFLQRIMDAGRL